MSGDQFFSGLAGVFLVFFSAQGASAQFTPSDNPLEFAVIGSGIACSERSVVDASDKHAVLLKQARLTGDASALKTSASDLILKLQSRGCSIIDIEDCPEGFVSSKELGKSGASVILKQSGAFVFFTQVFSRLGITTGGGCHGI